MSQKKKSKKKPSVLTNFHFLVNFIRHTGPMVTMVTRYTGGLSISKWAGEKKSKNSVLINFHFLVKVTSTRVTRECQICIKIEFEDEYPWKQWIWVEKLIFPVSVTQKEQLSGVFIFEFNFDANLALPNGWPISASSGPNKQEGKI